MKVPQKKGGVSSQRCKYVLFLKVHLRCLHCENDDVGFFLWWLFPEVYVSKHEISTGYFFFSHITL